MNGYDRVDGSISRYSNRHIRAHMNRTEEVRSLNINNNAFERFARCFDDAFPAYARRPVDIVCARFQHGVTILLYGLLPYMCAPREISLCVRV